MAQTKKGEKTRDHILKTTRVLLMANGFHDTSINDIIKAAGVTKGNLYYHFASKEDIGLAVLEDVKEEFFQFLADSFTGETACAKVANSCQAIFEEQIRNNLVGGCLFGNAALEMSDSNPRFSKVIRNVFAHWVEEIERYLSQAKAEHSLHLNVSPGMLARAIVATIEGGIMLSRVTKKQADLEDCLTVIMAMLGK